MNTILFLNSLNSTFKLLLFSGIKLTTASAGFYHYPGLLLFRLKLPAFSCSLLYQFPGFCHMLLSGECAGYGHTQRKLPVQLGVGKE